MSFPAAPGRIGRVALAVPDASGPRDLSAAVVRRHGPIRRDPASATPALFEPAAV